MSVSPQSGSAKVGRRAITPPSAGSRFCATLRHGVSLVELLVAVLILMIVCIEWMQIIGMQSARKEARRREAVERLAGMMDAFLYYHRNTDEFFSPSYYLVQTNANRTLTVKSCNSNVQAMFDGDVSPVGYQLSVVTKANLPNSAGFGNKWGGSSSKWLVGRLYNRSNCTTNDAGRPFFTLPVCLGL